MYIEKRNYQKISEYIFERKKRWKRNIMLHWNRQRYRIYTKDSYYENISDMDALLELCIYQSI